MVYLGVEIYFSLKTSILVIFLGMEIDVEEEWPYE